MTAAARRSLAAALLAATLAPGAASAVVSSGLLITSFISATYSFSSGALADTSDTGVSCINIPNSASSWVLVTDQPVLCMQGWKRAIGDGYGAPLPPPGTRAPGDLLCFEIGFSNCGEFTGWAVLITDVLPANVVKAQSFPASLWVNGGYGSILTPWSTTLAGPWYTYSNTGLAAPLYMRWLLGRVGLHKTGYVRYCVTVL